MELDDGRHRHVVEAERAEEAHADDGSDEEDDDVGCTGGREQPDASADRAEP